MPNDLPSLRAEPSAEGLLRQQITAQAPREYQRSVEELERENRDLWAAIRQKERDAYAANNALDVQALDARVMNLALEVARLTRERDEARRDADKLRADKLRADKLRALWGEATRERDEAREALTKYGMHLGMCNADGCECGLTAALGSSPHPTTDGADR